MKCKRDLTVWILCIALTIISCSCAKSSVPQSSSTQVTQEAPTGSVATPDDNYNIPYDSIQVNDFSENPQIGWSKATVQQYESRFFIYSGVYLFQDYGFALCLTDGLVSIITVNGKGSCCYGGITIRSTDADVIAKWGETTDTTDTTDKYIRYFINSSGSLCDIANAVTYVLFYLEDGIVVGFDISNIIG